VIFQRSRFCLVRAFREPFLTATRAHAGGGAGARRVDARLRDLKFTDLKDRPMGVSAAGVGALAGGPPFSASA